MELLAELMAATHFQLKAHKKTTTQNADEHDI